MWQSEIEWRTNMRNLTALAMDAESISWNVKAELVLALEVCGLSYQVWMLRLMLEDRLPPAPA